MKKFFAFLLALSMVFALCACGDPPDPNVLVGVWRGTYEWEGDHYEVSIEFKSDGTYEKTMDKNNSPLKTETGTYTEEGSEVVLKASTMGKTTYSFSNGKLTNNGHSLEKVK